MAQPKFQPIMSQASTPTYIRPGVVDNSSAISLSTIPGAIKAADSIFEEYSIRKAIEKDINPLTQTYEEGFQANLDTNANIALRETFWEEAQVNGQDSGLISRMDANEADLAANLQKIEKAKEQGVFTASEYMARVTKATREAINRNPWLQDKLQARVQEHLKNTGFIDAIKERESIATKQQDAYIKERDYYRQQHDSKGLPFDERLGPDGWRASLNAKHRQDQMEAFIKKEREEGTIRKKEEILSSLSSGTLGELRKTDIGRFTRVADQLLSQTKPGTPERIQALEAIKREANYTVERWSGQHLVSALDMPEVKDFRDSLNKSFKDLVDIYESSATQADYQKAVNNYVSILDLRQKSEAIGMGNKYALDLAVDWGNIFFKDYDIFSNMSDKSQKDRVMTALVSLAQGAVNNTAVTQFLTDKNANASSAFITFKEDLLDPNTNPFRKQEKIDNTLKFVSNVAQAIETTQFNDPRDKAKSTLQFLQAVASSNDMGAILGQYPEYGRAIGKLTDSHMKNVIDTFAATLFYETAADPSLKFEFDVLPNGALKVVASNPEIEKLINEKLGVQVNIALDAYANSLGKTRDQVKETFYRTYFEELLVNDPDIRGKGSDTITGVYKEPNKNSGNRPDWADSIKITPEQQAERDRLQTEVYKQELADYEKNGNTKAAEWVRGELKKRGVEVDEQKPNKPYIKPNDIRYLEERDAIINGHKAAISKAAQQAIKNNSLITGIGLAKLVAKSLGQKLEDVVDDVLNWEAEHRKGARKKLGLDKDK